MRLFPYWVALTIGAAVLTSGCRTYNQKNHGLEEWRYSNVQAASEEYESKANHNKTGKDAIIWHLEAGAALRAAGQFERSNRALAEAEARVDEYELEAKTKVANEAGALLSNQASLPYRGRAYDKIMMDAYEALNEMALGNEDRARVFLIRAYQRQQDAVAENARKIEKDKEEVAANTKPEDQERASQTQSDPAVQGKLDDAYKNLDTTHSYGDYVNPFVVYLNGLFFMTTENGNSDLERARVSLKRVYEMSGNNPYVREDLRTLEALEKGQPMPRTTYVIFENGLAPERAQLRIDLPLFVAGVRNVPYVGAAFPILAFQYGELPNLTVSGGGQTVTTAQIASMDSVIGREFKAELPGIITKTITSTVAKAAGAYFVNQAARQQGSIFGLISEIGTTITEAAINIADTRTWTTLPKEFQICRIPTPADGQLVVSSALGAPRTVVNLTNAAVNLVYVKSISQGAPFEITQSALRK